MAKTSWTIRHFFKYWQVYFRNNQLQIGILLFFIITLVPILAYFFQSGSFDIRALVYGDQVICDCDLQRQRKDINLQCHECKLFGPLSCHYEQIANTTCSNMGSTPIDLRYPCNCTDIGKQQNINNQCHQCQLTGPRTCSYIKIFSDVCAVAGKVDCKIAHTDWECRQPPYNLYCTWNSTFNACVGTIL